MNEKYFNAVRPVLGKAYELVSFIALANCKHVNVDLGVSGVTITAYPYEAEIKEKVMGLMRMYAEKDSELKEEYHTGEYHSWWTCDLHFNIKND